MTYQSYTLAVELAAEETKKADDALREATEKRKQINSIPKRKAGSGKGELNAIVQSKISVVFRS